MAQTLAQQILGTGLIKPHDCLLVGLSGGPDSVCLLHALASLKERMALTIYAAHLNHNLRGMEANQDAGFAMAFSKKMGIHCLVKSMDVEEIARQKKISIEAAGRLCRYQFLEEVAEKTGATKIAVAHHLNDQAETVLMHLLRGSGLTGLTGMLPHRRNIVRPLLNISRETILAYCDHHQLSYCRDATNEIPVAMRNRIRLELLPLLETYNPAIVSVLGGTAHLLQQDEAALDQMAEEFMKTETHAEPSLTYDRDKLTGLNDAILSRVIRKTWQELSQTDHTLRRIHVSSIIEALGRTGREKWFHLPGDIRVQMTDRSLSFLCLEKNHSPGSSMADVFLQTHGTTWLPQGRGKVHCQIRPAVHPVHFSQAQDRQIISADHLNQDLLIRQRRSGEYWHPLGLSGKKSIKKTLMEMKIPRGKRDDCLLLCHGEHVIWIMGGPISEMVRITPETRTLMVLEYRPSDA